MIIFVAARYGVARGVRRKKHQRYKRWPAVYLMIVTTVIVKAASSKMAVANEPSAKIGDAQSIVQRRYQKQ